MTTYRQNPAVVETDLGEELILIDPATREMFSLNATGRIVWRALAGEDGGRERAVAGVVSAFDVDADRAGTDVDALLAGLVAAGLVAESEGGNGTAEMGRGG